MEYTHEEMELMKGLEYLPKKKCKSCNKEFPIHKTFFIVEKRIKDGYENKCRKCRKGRYLTPGLGDNPKNVPVVDKTIVNVYKTIYDQYENYLRENKLPYLNFITDNHIELFKYLVEKENIQELNNLNRDWFKKKRLYSPLLKQYNGLIFDFVDRAYPNKYNPWDFATVKEGYWSVKENRINAIKWTINKLIETKQLDNVDEIPIKLKHNMFRQYSLDSMISKYYNHMYYTINEIYPNKFEMWQYTFPITGYYDNKSNRVTALKELIENHLKLNIDDLPKVLSFGYFYYNFNNNPYFNKFKTILLDYYNSDIYLYINDCYPNKFGKDEFPYKNRYITLDNIKVRSEPERQIHHLLINNNVNCKYGDEVGRMKINGTTVLPDWYIYNGNKTLLAEYYGMLEMTNEDFGYKDKFIMKEKLYKNLCNHNNKYEYLAIYKKDLDNSYVGLKNKLMKYNINIIKDSY